jgi:hypothetical protein
MNRVKPNAGQRHVNRVNAGREPIPPDRWERRVRTR